MRQTTIPKTTCKPHGVTLKGIALKTMAKKKIQKLSLSDLSVLALEEVKDPISVEVKIEAEVKNPVPADVADLFDFNTLFNKEGVVKGRSKAKEERVLLCFEKLENGILLCVGSERLKIHSLEEWENFLQTHRTGEWIKSEFKDIHFVASFKYCRVFRHSAETLEYPEHKRVGDMYFVEGEAAYKPLYNIEYLDSAYHKVDLNDPLLFQSKEEAEKARDEANEFVEWEYISYSYSAITSSDHSPSTSLDSDGFWNK